MSLIQLNDVRKEYLDGKTIVNALRGITLSIADGEFTAIAGPSGSGKTTLLNLVGGLDSVTAGSITLDNSNISEMKHSELTVMRCNKIGFVFQAYNLIPVLTALENVEFMLFLQGISKNERRKRSEEILVRIGLKEQLHRKPAAMSGGQQQRVAVARAIVGRPKVILADEPTANLDSDTGRALLEMMLELNRDENMTFIFSTHDPMVMEYSRRLVRLHDGQVSSDENQD